MRIRTLGDPVLREPAKPVTEFDRRLRTLRDDMLATMYDAPGVGLAGPQVGISLRLLRLRRRRDRAAVHGEPRARRAAQGELVEEEGCLSIPGPYHETTRFGRVDHVPRARSRRARRSSSTGEGLLARIFQHETDHLDGMLYIDRLDDEGRRSVMAELRRIELGLEDPPPKRRLLRRAEA